MTNRLRVTDQVRCYDAGGSEIPCFRSGQDASRKSAAKRAMISEGRFKTENRTVVDQLTGHIWTQNANPAEFPLNWQEAHAFVANLNRDEFSGFSGWQLPDRRTLFSLTSHQYINPALPRRHPFENVFPGYCWTGDSCSRLPDQAWYIHLGGARVFRGMKHGNYLTWPVVPNLQAAAFYERRFSSDPPLVFDHENKVSWLFDHAGFTQAVSWSGALESIRRLNRENQRGTSCWRLPNIRELESLVNIASHSPAVLKHASGLNIQTGYWSSTTSVYEPRYAWVLHTRDGEIGVGFKPHPEFHALGVVDGILK